MHPQGDLRSRILKYVKRHPRTYSDIAEYIWRISKDISCISYGTDILKNLVAEGLLKYDRKYVSSGWRLVFGSPNSELQVKDRYKKLRPRRNTMGGVSKKNVMLSLLREGVTDAKELAEKAGVPMNYAKTFLYRYKKGEFQRKPVNSEEAEVPEKEETDVSS